MLTGILQLLELMMMLFLIVPSNKNTIFVGQKKT